MPDSSLSRAWPAVLLASAALGGLVLAWWLVAPATPASSPGAARGGDASSLDARRAGRAGERPPGATPGAAQGRGDAPQTGAVVPVVHREAFDPTRPSVSAQEVTLPQAPLTAALMARKPPSPPCKPARVDGSDRFRGECSAQIAGTGVRVGVDVRGELWLDAFDVLHVVRGGATVTNLSVDAPLKVLDAQGRTFILPPLAKVDIDDSPLVGAAAPQGPAPDPGTPRTDRPSSPHEHSSPPPPPGEAPPPGEPSPAEPDAGPPEP